MSSQSRTRPFSGLTRRIVNVSRVLEEYSFPLLSGVLVGLVFSKISADSYEDMKHFNIFGHGVSFTSVSSVTSVVLLSLIVGKSLGITLFSWLGVRLGFPMPTGMAFKHLFVTGTIAGIGLMAALFVASKAFEGEVFYQPAKMGAVLSPVAVAVAFGAALLLKVKEPPPHEALPDK